MNNNLVDSHCHLNFPQFKENLDKVIDRASQAGVINMLTISIKLNDAKTLRQITKKYPQIYLHALNVPLDGNTFQMGQSPSFYKISDKEILGDDIQKHLMWTTKLEWTDPELALGS